MIDKNCEKLQKAQGENMPIEYREQFLPPRIFKALPVTKNYTAADYARFVELLTWRNPGR